LGENPAQTALGGAPGRQIPHFWADYRDSLLIGQTNVCKVTHHCFGSIAMLGAGQLRSCLAVVDSWAAEPAVDAVRLALRGCGQAQVGRRSVFDLLVEDRRGAPKPAKNSASSSLALDGDFALRLVELIYGNLIEGVCFRLCHRPTDAIIQPRHEAPERK